MNLNMHVVDLVDKEGAAMDNFEFEEEEIESEIMSLACNGEEGEVKGRGGRSKIGTVLHTAYHNDVLWMNFRALDPLSQQVSDLDGEEEVGYIRCMTRLKAYQEEYEIGRKVISRVKSGKNSVIFAEILPFLICWTLDVERRKPKSTGWLGLQEAKTSAELIANAKKLLSHVVMNQRKKRNILDDLSITDLSLAYLMMASWEELEEFCLKRGIKVVGPDLKDNSEEVHQRSTNRF